VLAPEFDARSWPGSRSYNLGNVVESNGGEGRVLPPERWSFTVVESLHDEARRRFGLADEGFDLWGHSAGGQFVHRLLLFRPQASVRRAIAAGCGWFTTPDHTVPFPYGLAHPVLRFDDRAVRSWLLRPLALMRGTADTDRDPDLRRTPAADAQGPNRYERTGHMLEAARRRYSAVRWRLVDVPGVGHDASAMAGAAQSLWGVS
jgi:pimeloyl-ACP methyl ester carboxylesterase